MNHIPATLLLFCYLAISPIPRPALGGVEAILPAPPLKLGHERIIQADGKDIRVPGYSVPSFVDWNGDKLKDLVIGEGSGSFPPGKVRVYLNIGTEAEPRFSAFFYVQSNGADLTVPASGCMGCFARVVYWDGDDRKDLLVGLADGSIKIYLNIGTDSAAVFDGGSLIKTTLTDSGVELSINVSGRATPTLADWNGDGANDLVVGSIDGMIHIYLNCPPQADANKVTPQFCSKQLSGAIAQENGGDLIVPSGRSSPEFFDFDGDGKMDLLTGNTNGQLLLYRNIGTKSEPAFAGYSLVQSDGVSIDLAGSARSRPFVCFWTSDGYPDILLGAGDGKVHFYEGLVTPGDLNADGKVNCVDFALFAAYWRYAPDHGQLDKADLTGDGIVNIDDLRRLAANWLIGVR